MSSTLAIAVVVVEIENRVVDAIQLTCVCYICIHVCIVNMYLSMYMFYLAALGFVAS